jgi:hypothetical protein
MVDTARLIWCFPDFRRLPDSLSWVDGDLEKESSTFSDFDTTLENVKCIQDLDERFPDPLFFSVGIYVSRAPKS